MTVKDYYAYLDSNQPLPAGLSESDVSKQMYLVVSNEKTYGGYFVFRHICWHMPMMLPLIPVIFFPGMGILGPFAYGLVAKNRRCLLKKANR